MPTHPIPGDTALARPAGNNPPVLKSQPTKPQQTLEASTDS